MHLFVLHEQPKLRSQNQTGIDLALAASFWCASYRYITTFISDDILAIEKIDYPTYYIDKIGLFICQNVSDFKKTHSFEKLISFYIEVIKGIFSKPLFRGRKFDPNFCIIQKRSMYFKTLSFAVIC